MTVLVALHVLAAVIWVGGMFFAYLVLRPSAGALEPPMRLALWRRVFDRFFAWVWAAVVVLLASGIAMIMIGFGGFAAAPVYISTMMAIGIIMMLIFAHLFFASWKRFGRLVDAGQLPDAARELDEIRRIVAINLTLGLITVVIGASGRYW